MPQIDSQKIESMLEKVSKPARYIGNEWNVAKKDFDSAGIRVALCFPDVYEIGMSHLGFKILYHLLNEQPGVACERVFTPWMDMQDVLRQEGLPLFSLESKRPLVDFDIVGFSLGHELNYTNVLTMLSLAGIPLKAAERGGDYPLIIAGGVCVVNPEPIAEFFDAFFIGEAEEGILEILDIYKKSQAAHGSPLTTHHSPQNTKLDLLKNLSKIEGIYVPSFYEVAYCGDGTIKSFTPRHSAPAVVKKRIVKDFENAYYPTKQIVPYIQIVHDRISLEVMRGCPNTCRFCQATSIYWPRRQRPLDKILQLAEEAYQATGYEEISLVSLSTGDHTQILDIVKNLIDRFKSRCVSVSLPSLRAEAMISCLPQLISSIKKTGLTFAPESGSQRLRDLINKRLDLQKLYECAAEAAKHGWRRVKLYFMVGLPSEEEGDLTAIRELIKNISMPDALKGKPAISVTASVSYFVPKPHTPFEREPMLDTATINARQSFLQKALKGLRVDLKWHDSRMSFLEGALSRGDRRLSEVVLKAHQLGARFDSWREAFDFRIWEDAFRQAGVSPDFYLYRQKGNNEILPWSHIDCGLPRKLYAK